LIGHAWMAGSPSPGEQAVMLKHDHGRSTDSSKQAPRAILLLEEFS
jgi:hypothetical protein